MYYLKRYRFDGRNLRKLHQRLTKIGLPSELKHVMRQFPSWNARFKFVAVLTSVNKNQNQLGFGDVSRSPRAKQRTIDRRQNRAMKAISH